jgi:ATP-dependent Clp protease, protease subunit
MALASIERTPAVGNLELNIYEPIGADFLGEGLTAKTVAEKLQAAGKPETITVNINSPGGVVAEGQAIYNVLHRSGARVVVNVDGMAASAASVIAMVGDEINVAENATMMVHDAWGLTRGPADDHRAAAEVLDLMSNTIAAVYAGRTGKTAAECRALMNAETWMDAAKAVSLGFATKVTPAKQLPKASWEGSKLMSLYKHPPSAAPRPLARLPLPRRCTRPPSPASRYRPPSSMTALRCALA